MPESNIISLDALRSRLDYASQHGFQFGSQRDIYKALGYSRSITLSEYKDAYLRGGIAKRIVDANPQATWRGDVLIEENGTRKRDSRFEAAWKKLNRRLDVSNYFERVDRLAGLGRYAVMLLGFGDADLSKPPSTRATRELRYLSVFAEENAKVESFVDDIRDERFGLPRQYEIQMAADQASDQRQRTSRPVKVHHSRIIHVADGLLENEVYGIPRLMPVWNLLYDLQKVVGGSAEMFWRGGYQGLQFDVNKDAALTQQEIDDLDEQLLEWEHSQRRAFQTRDITVKSIPTQFSDPRGNAEVLMNQISGTTGIPQRILTGSEMGRLASQQDRLNWADRIEERRIEFAEPRVARACIDRLIQFGVLPKPVAPDYNLIWPDVVNETQAEKSQNAQRFAQAAVAFQSQHQTISIDEAREKYLDLPAEMEGTPFEEPVAPEPTNGDIPPAPAAKS